MVYPLTVLPAHLREQTIADHVNASDTKTEPFYDFQNRQHDLKVITIPIGLPVYRMANYRTRIAQQAYIRREGLPADYFSAGEENETAQKQQHEFLEKYAREGRAGSVTPIIDVLSKEKQHHPLLITSRGVVVNGNRRLAGMRDLLAKGEPEYASFSHVKCQVLPATATAQEIQELEVRLQMKQETKLEYDWLNECIAVKELRDGGMDLKVLAGIMNKRKGDIEDSINALTEAELYLSEWRNTPFDYEAIEDAKQLFYDMGENLSTKSGEAQEVSRRIAWALVDRRSTLGRRVYDFKPMFGKKSDEVAAKLADRFEFEIEDNNDLDEDGDDFEVDLGEADAGSMRPLIRLMDDNSRREKVSAALVDVCEGIIEFDKGKKDGFLPLNQVQRANSLLSEIDMTRALPESLSAIDNQLVAIEQHVERLRGFLDRQRARTAGAEG